MMLRYVLQALRRRPAETFAAALVIALTVAFLASLGSFTAQTGARLTVRAAGRVPVDWQVAEDENFRTIVAKGSETAPGICPRS